MSVLKRLNEFAVLLHNFSNFRELMKAVMEITEEI